MQSVDHTNLHNAIVQKAFESCSAVLTEEQKQQLFQAKIERAIQAMEARKDCPVYNRSSLYSKYYR